MLQTFGGLKLQGESISQKKPLLLLTYLAIEGSSYRRDLADLFYLTTKNPRDGLSTALKTIRKANSDLIIIEGDQIATPLTCDVSILLKTEQPEAIIDLYKGSFLKGLDLDLGEELEEWVYGLKEMTANHVRKAHLKLAIQSVNNELFSQAANHAEEAYFLSGASEPDESLLTQLYLLLRAGNSSKVAKLQKEAAQFGIDLKQTQEEAKEELKHYFENKVVANNNLMTAATSFIGRQTELTELFRMLNDRSYRFITLLGSGGVGKSRLATELAFRCLEENSFPEGVYFIQLEATSKADLVPSSIANALAINLNGTSSIEKQLITYLHERRVCLILDNFEHLMTATNIPTKLLAGCPNLKIVITSRERLNVPAEWVYPIKGLALPSKADLEQMDAVNLFSERAKKYQPSFQLDDNTLPYVIEVCQLVEGMPLAIELASTWLRVISIQSIASEITVGMDIFESSLKQVPDRHRSLRATFEYSWILLTAHEQSVLKKLSVFIGGFSREAAREVTKASLPSLASLIDKSLIRMEESKYTLHPLINQFLTEKLTEDPKAQPNIISNHKKYYMGYLAQHQEAIWFPKQAEITQYMLSYLANFIAAWQTALMSQDLNTIQNSSLTFQLVFSRTSRFYEGIKLYLDSVNLLDSKKPEHHSSYAQLKLDLAFLQLQNGQLAESKINYQEIIPMLSELNDSLGLSRAQNGLGSIYEKEGDFDKANHILHKNLQLQEEATASKNFFLSIGEAISHLFLGSTQEAIGNYAIALEHYNKAITIDKRIGSQSQLIRDHYYLAKLFLVQHDFETAIQIGKNAFDAALTAGTIHYSVPIHLHLGTAYLNQDKLKEAEDHLQKALKIVNKNQQLLYKAELYCQLGNLYSKQDKQVQAKECYLQSLEIAHNMYLEPLMAEILMHCAKWLKQKNYVDLSFTIASIVNQLPSARFSDKTEAKTLLATFATKPNRHNSLKVEFSDLFYLTLKQIRAIT